MVIFSAAALLIAAAALANPVASEPITPIANRVRSDNPSIAALIQHARDQSATFSGIVDALNATDGIVYVEEGQCGHGVRACLVLKVTVAGPNRVLRVIVDTRKADWDLMGSIGHELRHAVEVLSHPTNTSDGAVYFFYQREGVRTKGVFETTAAIAAGDAVRSEVRRPAGLTR